MKLLLYCNSWKFVAVVIVFQEEEGRRIVVIIELIVVVVCVLIKYHQSFLSNVLSIVFSYCFCVSVISSHSAAERDRTRAGQSSVIEHEVLLLQVVECCDGSSSIQYQVDKMFSSASNVKQNKTNRIKKTE